MKLLFGLAGGLTLGSAATIVLTDPVAMQAVEDAFSTMDPEAGATAAQAVAGIAQQGWPLYLATWAIVLTWKFGEPVGKSVGVWLTHLADRHHAREVRRQKLTTLVKPPETRAGAQGEEPS